MFLNHLIHFLFRYISKEILTIREAVWLTDNTYKYEDLVRMMGEVVSVLEGKIRVRRTTRKKSVSYRNHWRSLWCNMSLFSFLSGTSESHAAGLRGGPALSAPSGEANHSLVQIHLWAVAALLCLHHAASCQTGLRCTTPDTGTTSLW